VVLIVSDTVKSLLKLPFRKLAKFEVVRWHGLAYAVVGEHAADAKHMKKKRN
jgi:hypothetical protein